MGKPPKYPYGMKPKEDFKVDHRMTPKAVLPGELHDEECDHQLDLYTLAPAMDCQVEIIDGERLEFVIDMNCCKCGTSGSFQVVVKLADINW